jgi:hypothetical protein
MASAGDAPPPIGVRRMFIVLPFIRLGMALRRSSVKRFAASGSLPISLSA